MQKVLLGFLMGLAATSFALTRNDDGSVVLSREEARQIEINWWQMEQALQGAYKQIAFLNKQMEDLQKAKCS